MDMMACAFHKSELLFKDRFNLSTTDRYLVAEEVAAPGAPVPVGGPFAGAWRNYLQSVFKKGFVYKLSSNPSAVFYMSENKTLAGKYDRTYEGSTLGRKLAIVLFEDAGGGEDLSSVCTENSLRCNDNS